MSQAKVKIVSDGTPVGTRVWVGESEVTSHLSGLRFDSKASGLAQVTLTACPLSQLELEGIVDLHVANREEVEA